jgi:hypothetical protein
MFELKNILTDSEIEAINLKGAAVMAVNSTRIPIMELCSGLDNLNPGQQFIVAMIRKQARNLAAAALYDNAILNLKKFAPMLASPDTKTVTAGTEHLVKVWSDYPTFDKVYTVVNDWNTSATSATMDKAGQSALFAKVIHAAKLFYGMVPAISQK